MLTSDRGDDIFDNVTTHEWDDDGAANQGAATMAEYLTSNHG